MSNLAKLEFAALDISGKNYLSWVLDAEIHLDAKSLGDTIKTGNTASKENKAKAMIFLRHHLHEDLKSGYLTERDPLELWENLKQRYDHQKTIILPSARYEWTHLRLQDFKSVADYNSAMYRITSQLRLCGEKISDDEMLEKTYSTFHPSNIVLSQQHRQKGYTKYFDLMNRLLAAEKTNELILKNHQTRPTGSTPAPFPEANAVINSNDNKKERSHASSRGRGHGRGRGRGGYRGNRGGHTHRGDYRGGRGTHFKGPSRHQKWQKNENHGKEKMENTCFRCGARNHWSRTCRTPKHLVELYQQSLKNKGNNVEKNFAFDDDDLLDEPGSSTHLEVGDFFEEKH